MPCAVGGGRPLVRRGGGRARQSPPRSTSAVWRPTRTAPPPTTFSAPTYCRPRPPTRRPTRARGGGVGVDRYMYKVDEDPEVRTGTIAAACPPGGYTIEARISAPDNTELASARANFTIVAPAAEPASAATATPTPTTTAASRESGTESAHQSEGFVCGWFNHLTLGYSRWWFRKPLYAITIPFRPRRPDSKRSYCRWRVDRIHRQ